MTRDNRSILRPRARLQMLAWVLTITLAVVATWVCSLAVDNGAQAQRWQIALDAARARAAQRPPPPPSRVAVEEARRWEALAAERSFSWYPVFRALEAASSPEIELLEFLPEKENGRLTLRGEARNLEALTSYLSALSAHAPLVEVYLARQKIINRSGMSLLSFEIRTGLAIAGTSRVN